MRLQEAMRVLLYTLTFAMYQHITQSKDVIPIDKAKCKKCSNCFADKNVADTDPCYEITREWWMTCMRDTDSCSTECHQNHFDSTNDILSWINSMCRVSKCPCKDDSFCSSYLSRVSCPENWEKFPNCSSTKYLTTRAVQRITTVAGYEKTTAVEEAKSITTHVAPKPPDTEPVTTQPLQPAVTNNSLIATSIEDDYQKSSIEEWSLTRNSTNSPSSPNSGLQQRDDSVCNCTSESTKAENDCYAIEQQWFYDHLSTTSWCPRECQNQCIMGALKTTFERVNTPISSRICPCNCAMHCNLIFSKVTCSMTGYTEILADCLTSQLQYTETQTSENYTASSTTTLGCSREMSSQSRNILPLYANTTPYDVTTADGTTKTRQEWETFTHSMLLTSYSSSETSPSRSLSTGEENRHLSSIKPTAPAVATSPRVYSPSVPLLVGTESSTNAHTSTLTAEGLTLSPASIQAGDASMEKPTTDYGNALPRLSSEITQNNEKWTSTEEVRTTAEDQASDSEGDSDITSLRSTLSQPEQPEGLPTSTSPYSQMLSPIDANALGTTPIGTTRGAHFLVGKTQTKQESTTNSQRHTEKAGTAEIETTTAPIVHTSPADAQRPSPTDASSDASSSLEADSRSPKPVAVISTISGHQGIEESSTRALKVLTFGSTKQFSESSSGAALSQKSPVNSRTTENGLQSEAIITSTSSDTTDHTPPHLEMNNTDSSEKAMLERAVTSPLHSFHTELESLQTRTDEFRTPHVLSTPLSTSSKPTHAPLQTHPAPSAEVPIRDEPSVHGDSRSESTWMQGKFTSPSRVATPTEFENTSETGQIGFSAGSLELTLGVENAYTVQSPRLETQTTLHSKSTEGRHSNNERDKLTTALSFSNELWLTASVGHKDIDVGSGSGQTEHELTTTLEKTTTVPVFHSYCSKCNTRGTKSCQEAPDGFLCVCRDEWTGPTCWNASIKCGLTTNLDCGPGESCAPVFDISLCSCADQYGAQHCDSEASSTTTPPVVTNPIDYILSPATAATFSIAAQEIIIMILKAILASFYPKEGQVELHVDLKGKKAS